MSLERKPGVMQGPWPSLLFQLSIRDCTAADQGNQQAETSPLHYHPSLSRTPTPNWYFFSRVSSRGKGEGFEFSSWGRTVSNPLLKTAAPKVVLALHCELLGAGIWLLHVKIIPNLAFIRFLIVKPQTQAKVYHSGPSAQTTRRMCIKWERGVFKYPWKQSW